MATPRPSSSINASRLQKVPVHGLQDIPSICGSKLRITRGFVDNGTEQTFCAKLDGQGQTSHWSINRPRSKLWSPRQSWPSISRLESTRRTRDRERGALHGCLGASPATSVAAGSFPTPSRSAVPVHGQNSLVVPSPRHGGRGFACGTRANETRICCWPYKTWTSQSGWPLLSSGSRVLLFLLPFLLHLWPSGISQQAAETNPFPLVVSFTTGATACFSRTERR